MPILRNDTPTIKQICLEKQQVEQKLSRRLYDAFQTGDAGRKVRDVVTAALETMLASSALKITLAISAEMMIEVWRKAPSGKCYTGLIEIYEKLCDPTEQFRLSDYSDLIRLIGAWVEMGGVVGLGATGGVVGLGANTTSESVMKAYRPGPSLPQQRPANAPDGWAATATDQAVDRTWADGKGRFQGMPKRRDRAKGWAIEPHLQAFFSGCNVAGMVIKRATGQSNTLKIDRIFGLVTGADISGTTADSTFVLENWGWTLNSAFYLLPMATLVYNGHHSLLEVALTLSLNKIIDYHIGMYHTLLPVSGANVQISQATAAFRSTIGQHLADAEKSPQNRILLIWYKGAEPAGAVQFFRTEAGIYGKDDILRATKWLEWAPTLPDYPTKEQLLDVLKQRAPAFYAELVRALPELVGPPVRLSGR